MTYTLQEQMDIIRKHIGEETITDSWYYQAIKYRNGKMNSMNSSISENDVKLRKLDELTKKNKYKFMKDGLTLIKPELADEWLVFVNNNINNSYFVIIIEAIILMMNKLNEGFTFHQVKQNICVEKFELSEFQIRTALHTLYYFYKGNNLTNNQILENISERVVLYYI